jgi:hypothetical protein
VDSYELRRAAYEAVAIGDAEIVGEEDGEPIFALTEGARERAEEIIDAAILNWGDEAPAVLAESLGVPIEVGEGLVQMRLAEDN